MRIQGTEFELTYCLNVHPGEGLDDIMCALRDFALPLKERISPRAPFGLGLRLANRASRELLEEPAAKAFRGFLDENNLYALTVNGFPFGDFHAGRVKEAVYHPDWTSPERLDYTERLARILAGLLPENGEGSISSCPIAYASPRHDRAERARILETAAAHLIELAGRLERLHEESGRCISADLEPEPDGLLENSAQVVDFFQGPLRIAARNAGMDEARVRRYVGICYDTCHFAVLGENPMEAFAALRKAEIRVGKIQLSSALAVRVDGERTSPAAAARALNPFADSVYLHQTVGRQPDGTVHRFADLDEALPRVAAKTNIEWRTHFHVPVFLESYGILGSTRDELETALRIARGTKATRVLEIETYTWDVLPPDMKGDLTESLEREYDFVLGALRGEGMI